jgi:hypothetical protein
MSIASPLTRPSPNGRRVGDPLLRRDALLLGLGIKELGFPLLDLAQEGRERIEPREEGAEHHSVRRRDHCVTTAAVTMIAATTEGLRYVVIAADTVGALTRSTRPMRPVAAAVTTTVKPAHKSAADSQIRPRMGVRCERPVGAIQPTDRGSLGDERPFLSW